MSVCIFIEIGNNLTFTKMIQIFTSVEYNVLVHKAKGKIKLLLNNISVDKLQSQCKDNNI